MSDTPNNEFNTLIGHLFRHHAGKMAAVLSRIFGVANIDIIEDAIQDAMITALKRWPFTGTPENPEAWLTQVAKNRIIDRLRRESRAESLDQPGCDFADDSQDSTYFSSEIGEDQLRMIFACCHPSIPPDSQVALTLKIVGGFSVGEIARCYLATNSSVAKLLSRAKSKLRSGGVPLEIPSDSHLNERISAVLKVLYLMFNEGYSPTAGDEIVRKDLCFEAIRLVETLADHPVTGSSRVNALAALFYFHAARLGTRSGGHGELLLLADQDREQWDRAAIRSGVAHLKRSAAGNDLTDYHLEAEIAALYTLAPDYASTDWHRIIECYETLQQRKFSPVIELNRIIVLGEIHGAQAASEHLKCLEKNPALARYNLFHITKAHYSNQLGLIDAAAESLRRAAKLTNNKAVRRFVEKRLAELGG